MRSTLFEDTFVGPNVERKIIPECKTPMAFTPTKTIVKSPRKMLADLEQAYGKERTTVEEKVLAVVSDPKFGMFSLFMYHVYKGRDNQVLKERNTVFCSHLFSLIFALPILVFVTQWTMYLALVANQYHTYDAGLCPNAANIEQKMLMVAISLFYFIKSFFLWDNIVDRTHRKKMVSSASAIVMLDTFQEFGFNLLVYTTNLWVIFAEGDFLNMFFNTLAMEFLMEMDNEFERMYFEYLPEVAVDIYDNQFVTYRENIVMVNRKTHDSVSYRCCRRVTWLPFKLLILIFMAMPLLCFAMIVFGAVCK